MSVFGLDLPTPVYFIIAFVFVLLLIGAAAWLVRRFGATHIDAAARGRQPRLAVIDSAAIDGRRKLIIIRRDNVEHLLMIGGPSDVVVESNIVRGAAVATRDAPPPRGADAPRAMPMADPTPWPLQPEPAPAAAPVMAQPVRAERTPRIPSDDAWQAVEPVLPAPPIPEVRPVRSIDTLAGLAEDLARPAEPVAVRPVQVQVQPQRAAAQPAAMSAPQMSAPQATDQSLAEMAQRLEAALRRPTAQKVVAETQRVTATVEVRAGVPKAAMQPRGNAQPKPQGDLEQEMASLLSRPGKP
ncbi:MAG: flagellar biosynthetic protein FliO [Alphaproteobacteria bacterium]|nr:flagellar biosynthetic protein FliO [Alphaproteobacteria bacterium]